MPDSVLVLAGHAPHVEHVTWTHIAIALAIGVLDWRADRP